VILFTTASGVFFARAGIRSRRQPRCRTGFQLSLAIQSDYCTRLANAFGMTPVILDTNAP
jgi:hypothetical protein